MDELALSRRQRLQLEEQLRRTRDTAGTEVSKSLLLRSFAITPLAFESRLPPSFRPSPP
jgi:hypothetical protein